LVILGASVIGTNLFELTGELKHLVIASPQPIQKRTSTPIFSVLLGISVEA
jgi:hypothetical protein